MLKTVDDGFKNVTDALVAKGRWDTTLMVVSSDNGTQLRSLQCFVVQSGLLRADWRTFRSSAQGGLDLATIFLCEEPR